mgnify:CR=1 FL=1
MFKILKLNKMSTNTKPKKLKEILSEDNSHEDMDLHIDGCKNTTELEMLKVRDEINKQKKIINGLYRRVNFSASEIYTERLKLELLEKKLKGLTEILKELF